MDAGGFLCAACGRVTGYTEDGMTCEAYPNGVPSDILNGGDHRATRGDETVPVAFALRSGRIERLARWRTFHDEALAKRYDPAEPRDEIGRWAATGAIATHAEAPHEPTGPRAAPRPENPHATKMSGLSAKTQTKVLDALGSIHTEPNPGGLFGGSHLAHLTPEAMEANLEHLWGRMEREAPEVIAEGSHWYAHAQGRILEHAAGRYDARTAIGITAALSPQAEWGQNIAVAGHVMRSIHDDVEFHLERGDVKYLTAKGRGGRTGPGAKTLLEKVRGGRTVRMSDLTPEEAGWAIMVSGKRAKMVGEVATPKGNLPRASFSMGSASIAKAVRIARGEDPAAVLSGHKVRSFFDNLADPYDRRGRGEVTIDTHAMSAAARTRMSATSKNLKRVFASSPSVLAENVHGTYPAVADAFRRVAARHGLTANQAQASLWLYWQKVRFQYGSDDVGETMADVTRKARRYGVQPGGAGS